MQVNRRWMACLIAVSLSGLTAGCDGGNGGDEDSGAGVDGGHTGTDGGPTDSGSGDVDAGPVTPAVTVANQTLDDLSTIVTIAEADSDGPGWIVIHEQAGTDPGQAIGHAHLDAGRNANVAVTLERPAVDGETLYAMLHTDGGTVGTFEGPGDPDGPVSDASGVIAPPFLVTVPDGTPAVRLHVINSDFSAWNIVGADPAEYADSVGDGSGNQTITLRRGWRYEIDNPANPAHPFQLINDVATDVVATSQGATDGTLESDGTVDFVEVSDTAFDFTVSASFEAAVTAYRCGIHTTTMRGSVAYAAP